MIFPLVPTPLGKLGAGRPAYGLVGRPEFPTVPTAPTTATISTPDPAYFAPSTSHSSTVPNLVGRDTGTSRPYAVSKLSLLSRPGSNFALTVKSLRSSSRSLVTTPSTPPAGLYDLRGSLVRTFRRLDRRQLFTLNRFRAFYHPFCNSVGGFFKSNLQAIRPNAFEITRNLRSPLAPEALDYLTHSAAVHRAQLLGDPPRAVSLARRSPRIP